MNLYEALTQEKIVVLGRYQVVHRIGRGGMGDVWLCDDPRLKRQVAVKTLPAYHQLDHDFIRRFEQEAEAAAALSHPHVVSVHDFGQQALNNGMSIPYIVMPYIKGGSLADRLLACEQQSKRLPPDVAFAFLKQAAAAIDYAHTNKLVHRDIKPANMLLRSENWLLLTDFGIACILTDEEAFDEGNLGVGTPEYMAPEQAQGHVRITSDNYSLAVVAYQLFTGQLPFQGETAIATTMQHLTQPPPSPRQFNPALSAACEEILLQGLAKDPTQRPALASEFVAQLEQAFTDPIYQPDALRTLNDIQEMAVQDAALIAANETVHHAPEPVAKWPRRQILYAGGISAALLTGGLTGTWAWWNTIHQGPPSIAANSPLSARPTTTGANAPVLTLTGHTNPVSQLAWTLDASKLISLDPAQAQLLAWDIAQLRTHPIRSPLYSAARAFPASDNPYFSLASDDTFLALIGANIPGQETDITFYTLQLDAMAGSNKPIPPSNSTTQMQGIFCLPYHYIIVAQTARDKDNQYQIQILRIAQTSAHVVESTPWQTETVSGGGGISLVPGPTNAQRTFCIVYGQGSTQITEIQFTTPTTIHEQVYTPYVPFPEIISSPGSQVLGSSMTADGRYLLAIGDNHVTGNPIHYLDRHTNTTQTLSFPANVGSNVVPVVLACNPNPHASTPMVAAGTSTGSIYLWNIAAGASPLRQLDVNAIQAEVQSLAWSSDGQWLAASFADDNCTILIWKL